MLNHTHDLFGTVSIEIQAHSLLLVVLSVKLLFTSSNSEAVVRTILTRIGYEPAGLTVHPSPQNDRGWVYFFRMGV